MDFVVLKINGKDVSEASHEQVINTFNQAKQPIIMEIITKNENLKSSNETSAKIKQTTTATINNQFEAKEHPKSKLNKLCIDVSTQTDFTWLEFISRHRCFQCNYICFSSEINVLSWVRKNCLELNQKTNVIKNLNHNQEIEEAVNLGIEEEIEVVEEEEEEDVEEADDDDDEPDEDDNEVEDDEEIDVEEDDQDSVIYEIVESHSIKNETENDFYVADFTDDVCDAFEYKEFTWKKTKFEDKLKIDLETDEKLNQNKQSIINQTQSVYVKSIDLPENCGLKNGDQLLEINGIAVLNLEEAKYLLNCAETQEFNILFRRPNLSHNHTICEEKINLKKRKSLWLKQNIFRNKHKISQTTLTNDNMNHKKEDEKDSGFGKQTDLESICTQTNETCSDYEYYNETCSQTNILPGKLVKSSSTNSLDKEILMLNKEIENIKVECEKLNQNYILNNESSLKEVKSCLNVGNNKKMMRQLSDLSDVSFSRRQIMLLNKNLVDDKKQSVAKWLKNVNLDMKNNLKESNLKPKYNIQNSNETLLNCKLNDNFQSDFDFNYQKLSTFRNKQTNDENCTLYNPSEHEYAVINYENTSSLKLQSPPPLPPPLPPQLKNSKIFNRSTSNHIHLNNHLNSHKLILPDQKFATATMYTNKANLHHTMLLQQQLLRQVLKNKQNLTSSCSVNQITKNINDYHLSSFNANNSATSKQIDSHSSSSSSSQQQIDESIYPNLKTLINTSQVYNLHSNEPQKNQKLTKNTILIENTLFKIKRRPDGTRYISSKKMSNKTIKKKVIDCSENVINSNEDNCKCCVVDKNKAKKLKHDSRKSCTQKAKTRNNCENSLLQKTNETNNKIKLKFVEQNRISCKKKRNLDACKQLDVEPAANTNIQSKTRTINDLFTVATV